MDTYDDTQAARFRAALLESAARLRALLAHETDGARADSPREPAGFADDASRVAESEIDDTQAAHAAAALGEVEAALRRISLGTYGRCAGCGAAIDLRRLAAVPATSLCTACQGAREKT